MIVLCRTPLSFQVQEKLDRAEKRKKEATETSTADGKSQEVEEVQNPMDLPMLYTSFRRIKNENGIVEPVHFQYLTLLAQEIDVDLSES